MIENRLKAVRHYMEKACLQQIIITQPQSIFYLTGMWVEPHDRLDALIVTKEDCRMLCYVLAVIEPGNCQVKVYENTGDTVKELAALLDTGRTGADGFMQGRFLLPLKEMRPDLNLVVSSCVEEARMVKDEREVALLKEASRITDAVFQAVFSQLREGMTELECGALFSDGFLNAGVGRFQGDPMVAFGLSTAQPHNAPGNTRLKPGDTVWVDTGKRINGYYSDLTRTVFFKDCTKKQEQVYQTVLAANQAALDKITLGVPIHEIDRAAREMIENAGYGQCFPHRTSHGIGIDYHEEPFDVGGRILRTQPGMCFSIEPGIYLPGEFGVRIEDLVAATETGYTLLTNAPKTLTIIG